MNNKILGLRTVIYKVGDIGEAKNWYSLIFETQPYFDEPFYVGFNIAGYELGLDPEIEPTTQKPESVKTYWGVQDVHAEYSRMISLGAIAHEEPQNVGGEIIAASLKDPWGNIIGLIYSPEFRLPKL
jgi:lactoylglutathione lyase